MTFRKAAPTVLCVALMSAAFAPSMERPMTGITKDSHDL